jgi:hypothetical protein
MIPLVLAVIFLGLVTSASGQRRGPPTLSGVHDSFLHRDSGHASVTSPGHDAWPSLLGRPVSAARPALGSTATPGGAVVIAVPVYQDGNLDEESGMYLPADGNPPQASANPDDRAPVVLDQNFASPPDASQFANRYPANGRNFEPPGSQNPVTSCVSAVQGTPNKANNSGKPTIYLIAFKDHRIMQALGYWIEGTMLHYVSVDYAFNHASISLIDSDVSQRLNHERGIEFTLTGLE